MFCKVYYQEQCISLHVDEKAESVMFYEYVCTSIGNYKLQVLKPVSNEVSLLIKLLVLFVNIFVMKHYIIVRYNVIVIFIKIYSVFMLERKYEQFALAVIC